jgi:hypothetical protein
MSVGLVINATMAPYPAPTLQYSLTAILGLIAKALGVGILFAALEQTAARGGCHCNHPIHVTGNRPAADILRQHGCVTH